MKKHKCEVRTFICNNSLLRRMTGKKKDDPKFWCCGSCAVYLKRGGVKLVEVKS